MKARISYLLVVAIAIYLTILPTSNNYFLFPMLASLATWSAVVGIRSRYKLNPIWIPLIISWLVFVLFGISVALFNQVEYWPRVLVFLLIWPSVFSLIAFGAKPRIIKPFFTGGAIASIGISLLAITDSIVSQFVAPFALPAWLRSPFFLRHVLDSGQNYAYSSLFIPPLIFWSTIWFASLTLNTKSQFLPKNYVRIIAAVLTFSALVVSWRRGAILAVVIVVFLMLCIQLIMLAFSRNSVKTPQVIAVSLLSASLLAGLLISVPLQRQLWHFLPGIKSTSSNVHVINSNEIYAQNNIELEPTSGGTNSTPSAGNGTIEQDISTSDSLRKNELRYLTTWQNPTQLIFGRGIGAPIDRGFAIRDMKPWQTELQYFSLFYWTGILGLFLFIAVLYFAIRVFVHALRNAGELRPILHITAAGSLAILIANATNPYLQAPGHMLGMFLPIIVANIVFSSVASKNTEARKSMK